MSSSRNIYNLYTSGIIKNSNNEHSDNVFYQKILDQYNNRKFSEISLNILQQLKKAGLDKIVFDMQASEVDEYNLLMGTKNNFANILKSMLNSTKLGFKTSVHFVPNKVNVNQFRDVVELSAPQDLIKLIFDLMVRFCHVLHLKIQAKNI